MKLARPKKERRQTERRCYSWKLSVDLDILRLLRCKLNQLCQSAKSSYYQQQISECGNDAIAMFKITDTLMNKKQESVLPSHECSKAPANDIVSFFSEKIKNIIKGFPEISNNILVISEKFPRLEMFVPVTEKQLHKIILSGNSKSCLLDPVPTKLMKECLHCLLPHHA